MSQPTITPARRVAGLVVRDERIVDDAGREHVVERAQPIDPSAEYRRARTQRDRAGSRIPEAVWADMRAELAAVLEQQRKGGRPRSQGGGGAPGPVAAQRTRAAATPATPMKPSKRAKRQAARVAHAAAGHRCCVCNNPCPYPQTVTCGQAVCKHENWARKKAASTARRDHRKRGAAEVHT